MKSESKSDIMNTLNVHILQSTILTVLCAADYKIEVDSSTV